MTAIAGVPERTRKPISGTGLNRSRHDDTIEPETLRFGYGDTALGTIVVAESMRGVVALFIGDDRANLLRDLEGAFPEAEFVLDPTGLAQTIAKAAALVDAPHLGTDSAVDLRGSPVEVAVWKALQGDSRGRDAHLRLDRSEPADNGDGAGRRCRSGGQSAVAGDAPVFADLAADAAHPTCS